MRKKSKEATVQAYLKEYLEGKSEGRRNAFLLKDIDRQYSAIMAWKRRKEMKEESKGISAQDIIKHASSLSELIDMAENFTDREAQKLHEALDAAKEHLDNFHRVRKSRELRELQKAQEELQRRIDSLRAEGIE